MNPNQQNETQEFGEEYKAIKKDVARVVVTNLVIVIVLTGLYFANEKFGFLNNLQKLF